jgi:SAM-dependent methyltransferase
MKPTESPESRSRSAPASGRIVRVVPPVECCDPLWESAYQRFETSEEERRKFRKRFQRLGVVQQPRHLRVVALFCGRGNGLVVLEELGFRHLEGVDLSASLLQRYRGTATLYVADCRELPFEDGSRDLVIIQGGCIICPIVPVGWSACCVRSTAFSRRRVGFIWSSPGRLPS